jgi:hypothetical protein
MNAAECGRHGWLALAIPKERIDEVSWSARGTAGAVGTGAAR